ncbi:hypothetical protein AOQ84DRAFT_330998 [Glonium stellatum]|uniref:U1-type domain-containing protein n=1 Tax=Glonium stellatum TaxID=574774 RepID=A0A8E2FCI0_9PEZI|nr:hypothetical protein AOQ84DRAFT_330998 [Glonium stellatum]
MSEYWKSTPKYWCKFCKTYVRDTKFEKQQHEATPKHQNNIQRSLRELHRGHEREEREKQRAKDEVARLNGVVSGSGASSASRDPPWKKNTPALALPKQVSLEERKRQLEQLAELGVAVPEEFRPEMAMAGDWQVLPDSSSSTRNQKAQNEAQSLSIGVRKRKLEGEEEEEDAAQTITKKKGWGQTFKTFPGSKAGDEDLDALLNMSKPNQMSAIKDEATVKGEPDIKEETGVKLEPEIKEEPRESALDDVLSTNADIPEQSIKAEPDVPPTAVVFKKRKNKAIRQK